MRVTAGVFWLAVLVLCLTMGVAGCDGATGASASAGEGVLLADTTFMADIAQNVAGDRQSVDSLLAPGTDPHSFVPTPQDAKRVAECRAVVVNVAGLIPQLDDLLEGAGDGLVVIEAASGLPGALEDPHLWLDPAMVTAYVKNIESGLAYVDPDGAKDYRANGAEYSRKLHELDEWIAEQVATIPAERRLLVTNHESLGYFARRYGFRIVGTVFPSVSGEGSPSAQQLTTLIRDIESAGAPAIFLETGSNADLAEQVGRETGAKVVADLYVASVGENASTYLDMMRWNVNRIVEALR